MLREAIYDINFIIWMELWGQTLRQDLYLTMIFKEMTLTELDKTQNIFLSKEYRKDICYVTWRTCANITLQISHNGIIINIRV